MDLQAPYSCSLEPTYLSALANLSADTSAGPTLFSLLHHRDPHHSSLTDATRHVLRHRLPTASYASTGSLLTGIVPYQTKSYSAAGIIDGQRTSKGPLVMATTRRCASSIVNFLTCCFPYRKCHLCRRPLLCPDSKHPLFAQVSCLVITLLGSSRICSPPSICAIIRRAWYPPHTSAATICNHSDHATHNRYFSPTSQRVHRVSRGLEQLQPIPRPCALAPEGTEATRSRRIDYVRVLRAMAFQSLAHLRFLVRNGRGMPQRLADLLSD